MNCPNEAPTPQGETALFAAIIAQAKLDLETGSPNQFRKAFHWGVASELDLDRPGSLAWYAERLGWDSARVQLALRRVAAPRRGLLG